MILILSNISNSGIGLYIFLGVTVVAIFLIFLIIFFYVLNKKKNKRVLLASPYIKEIKEVNKKYIFQTLPRSSETKTFYLNSKRAYDNFDFYKRRGEFAIENLSYYQQVIQKINYNVSIFAEYKNELSRIRTTFDKSLAKANKMSLKSFRIREIKLGNKLIKRPQMSYSLRIRWEYTSPAGRNHYSNCRECSFNDIKSLVQQFTNTAKPESYYSDSRPRNTYSPSRSRSNEKIYTNDDIEDVGD